MPKWETRTTTPHLLPHQRRHPRENADQGPRTQIHHQTHPKIRSQIVWDKMVHGMGDHKSQFAPKHELIWWAVKGRFAFPGGRPALVSRCGALQQAAPARAMRMQRLQHYCC